jgi:hypothetical protein
MLKDIPTGTYLVLEGGGKAGMPSLPVFLQDACPQHAESAILKIGWSAKSVLLRWGRAIVCCALVLCPAFGVLAATLPVAAGPAPRVPNVFPAKPKRNAVTPMISALAAAALIGFRPNEVISPRSNRRVAGRRYHALCRLWDCPTAFGMRQRGRLF